MAQLVVETIWHFAGYAHLTELLATDPIHYWGGFTYRMTGYLPEADAPEGEPRVLFIPRASAPVLHGTWDGPEPYQQPGMRFDAPATIQGSSPGVFFLSPPTPPLAPPLSPALPLVVTLPGEFPPITLTYTDLNGVSLDVEMFQDNHLLDTDTLLNDGSMAGLANGLYGSVVPAIADMVKEVNTLIESSPEASFEDPGPAVVRYESATDSAPPTNGHFVNGVRVDGGVNPPAKEVIQEQIGKISDAFANFNEPVLDPAADRILPEPGSNTLEAHFTGSAPTGGYTQTAIAGDNKALNVAVLSNETNAASSIIIKGDLHESDKIVQINLLHDNDKVSMWSTLGADSQHLVAGNDAATNSAIFTNDPGTIYGDIAYGYPGAVNWQIDYVIGDYCTIDALHQSNVLIDGDLAQQSNASMHFTALLGANGQLNFVNFTEPMSDYDLIVVAGNVYKSNCVVQVNIVLNDDMVEQVLGGNGSQSVNAGSNILLNDAAIVNVGDGSFNVLAGDALDLANALASKDTSIDFSASLGLPGNGTDTFNVLFISGDFYEQHLLTQTNVIIDTNTVIQSAPDGAVGVPGADTSGGLAQTATTGGNEATNLALLVNVNSTSDYQFLGGTHYEDTLLVQANIVTDTDEIMTASDLHPDAVAAIAALSGSEADPSSSTQTVPTTVADPPGAHDTLGGLMH